MPTTLTESDRLVWVNPRFLDAVWPQASVLLKRALDLNPSYMTIDQLQLLVRRQGVCLLVWGDGETVKGAATIEFVDHPLKRVAHLMHAGGKAVVNQEVFAAVKQWCKDQGAVSIEAWCNAPRSRLYRRIGFVEQPHRIVQVEL